jgi:arylsulfatase A-like enzyme
MKKNILLITSDQQHFSLLGINNPKLKTPHLDRLAAEGMVFNRAYCPNPTCTPSRASIITGQYPSQHGAWALGTKLPEDIHVVGDDFKAAGYKTALVGKGHFQPVKQTEEFPSLEAREVMNDIDFWKNFKEPFYGFEDTAMNRDHGNGDAGQHYAVWLEENLPNWRDYFGGNSEHLDAPVWNLPEEFHYNTWITDQANQRLNSYKENDENFFLWISHPDPHGPNVAPERWTSMYNSDDLDVPEVTNGEHDKNPPHFQMTQQEKPNRLVYAEEGGHDCHGVHSHLGKMKNNKERVATLYGRMSFLDHYIGKTLDKLDELGLSENTLVVYTTDHGDFFGQHGLAGKGAFHFEDMIKLPFIARLPGVIQPGTQTDAMVSLVDLAPTFLDAIGSKIPRCMTGKSQMDVFSGKVKEVRDHIIVENHHQPTTLHLKTYVNDRYKLTVYYNQTYGELFDLEADPGEINNLWDDPESQNLKQELILKYIHAELGKEPMWMPRLSTA